MEDPPELPECHAFCWQRQAQQRFGKFARVEDYNGDDSQDDDNKSNYNNEFNGYEHDKANKCNINEHSSYL